MAEYINREDVLLLIDNGKLLSNSSYKSVKNLINMLPAADVVTRRCYDLILYQNDIMNQQLASIGKHFGEKMDDVRVIPQATEVTDYTELIRELRTRSERIAFSFTHGDGNHDAKLMRSAANAIEKMQAKLLNREGDHD